MRNLKILLISALFITGIFAQKGWSGTGDDFDIYGDLMITTDTDTFLVDASTALKFIRFSLDGTEKFSVDSTGILYLKDAQISTDDLSDVTSIAMLDENETITGSWVISNTTPTLDFTDTDAGDGDVGSQILVGATDTGSGTEDVDWSLYQQTAGALNRVAFFDADQGIWFYPSGETNNLVSITTEAFNVPDSAFIDTLAVGSFIAPSADDGAGLGISGQAFADLFLASGAVIDFGAGDVTVTHITGKLNITADIGINQPSPLYSLDIVDASDPHIRTRQSSAGVNMEMYANGTGGNIGTFSAHEVAIYTNSTARLTIDNAGDATFSGDADVVGDFTAGTIASDGSVTVNGAYYANITTVNAATYDLLTTDYILNVTYTGTGAVTSLTLPTAQTVTDRYIVIKDAGGNASVNNITVDTEGAETIDGAATQVISTDYGSITLYCDGSNWFII